MSSVATYLNFMGNTKEAFEFYKSVFKTDYTSAFQYMRDIPEDPSNPVPEDELDMVMHVELPIVGGHILMGTDMLKSMGHELKIGNNVTLSLNLDTEQELKELYAALSEGGSEKMEPAKMFWGALWGVCLDKYGIRWMFNCQE